MSRLVILTEIMSPYRIPVFNALARLPGVDLHVIFLAETDPTLRQWTVPKEQIRFSYQVLPSWRRRLGGRNLLLNRGLAAALRQAAPDAVLCGGYNYLASWQCLWWARRRRVRFLAWVESTQMDRRGGHLLVESLKTMFIRRCDGFIVPGKSSFDYIRSFKVPEERIFTAPNAVDTDFFASEAERVRRDAAAQRQRLGLPLRYFVFVGRLVPEKGIFDLLQAYAALPLELRTEVGLVFVGDGPARARLQQQLAAVAPGTVHFAGFAQRERLAAYYALAEVFVLPTHTDTWGLAVNEAMACGLPVVCSSTAGCVADLVTEGWNGRVFPAHEVSRLAALLGELAQSHELRFAMGLHSQERIQHYSPAACAQGIANGALLHGEAHA
jgi:glycosyltransferase involved in cell wall biosynthesis